MIEPQRQGMRRDRLQPDRRQQDGDRDPESEGGPCEHTGDLGGVGSSGKRDTCAPGAHFPFPSGARSGRNKP